MMKKIIYIVPYFGRFPDFFNMWLFSCKYNPTIDGMIITDDETEFAYPPNVHVFYMSFAELKMQIQKKYDFHIELSTPYRLCDYKVAYGDIFYEKIKEYDFWGYCDIDMFWGDVRSFMNEERLNNYDRIGYLGHSTIYKNNPEINTLYKSSLDGESVYEKIFQTAGNTNCFFDELYIGQIFDKYGKRTCKDLIFADLMPWSPKFMISYAEDRDMAKNRNRIFTWKKGHLFSHSLMDGDIEKDEFMYIHFLKRDMSFPQDYSLFDSFLIVPNRFSHNIPLLTRKVIKRNSSSFLWSFWWKLFLRNYHKISINNVVLYFKRKYRESKKINNMILNAELNEKN